MENDAKYDGMCEKCFNAGRGDIDYYFSNIQGVAPGRCTLSPNMFKVCINDMMIAVSKQ